MTPEQVAAIRARHERAAAQFRMLPEENDGTWEYQMHEDRGVLLAALEAAEGERDALKRIACWQCGRSPADEASIVLTRLNPKGVRGVFACQVCGWPTGPEPSELAPLRAALATQDAEIARLKLDYQLLKDDYRRLSE